MTTANQHAVPSQDKLNWLSRIVIFFLFPFYGGGRDRDREKEPEALVGDICIYHKSDP